MDEMYEMCEMHEMCEMCEMYEMYEMYKCLIKYVIKCMKGPHDQKSILSTRQTVLTGLICGICHFCPER